jgi:hypothetical protein
VAAISPPKTSLLAYHFRKCNLQKCVNQALTCKNELSITSTNMTTRVLNDHALVFPRSRASSHLSFLVLDKVVGSFERLHFGHMEQQHHH